MTARANRSAFLFVWLLVLVAGLVAGALAYLEARAANTRSLVADAARSALAFRPEEIAVLEGTRADLERAEYGAVKERLIRLRAIQPEVRFLSIFRCTQGPERVVYLADSEPADSREISLPGDVFAEAPQMPGLRSILNDYRPSIEGPIADSFGEFVTGYAVIGTPPAGAAAGPVHVLALDIASAEWSARLRQAALRATLIGWLLVGVPVAGYLWWRQRSSSSLLLGKLYAAVEQCESAIMIVNLESEIEFANTGLCQQTGYTREELVGRPWRRFGKDASLAHEFDGVVAKVRAGTPWEGSFTNRRKNGETYPARAVASPVRGPEGGITGFIAVITDVSLADRRERELRTAKEQAEAADRSKGRFLATMSHEVRTPLNGIAGFASLLADTTLTPEQREYVQTIRTSVQALVQLTGDILDFSRIESGKLQLDPAPCDLRAGLEDALDIFAGKAADKNLQLLHWVEPDVPAQVMIDCGRLRQVLINLIGNAVKFTASGEVEVGLRLLTGKSVSYAPFEDVTKGQLVAELDDGGITLEFSVRDTGIGIAEADRARLFQPFSQLDASTVRRFGGTGLGLAISRNLVRLMGGDIHVESEPGRGTTFIFTVRTRPAASGRPEEPAAASLQGVTVAVVAKPAGLNTELQRLIRLAGGMPLECAFEELKKNVWDIAVVDCEPSVARALGGEPAQAGWKDRPLFGLVSMQLSPTERQELRRHCRILLNKPAHHRTLMDLMAKAAADRAAKTAAPKPAQAGLNVLVAEDDVVQQNLLREVFETLGCTCEMVESGPAAIAKLAAVHYDFVLMDLHMLDSDGLTAIRQIRSGEAGEAAREAWIVSITGDVRPEIKEMCFTSGANDFLAKPLHLASLEAALQRCTAARRQPVH